jgi:dienelactone hydrolase
MTSAANLRIKTLQKWSTSLGAANYTPYHAAVKITVFASILTLASVATSFAQDPPVDPNNRSIDPWHIYVPTSVANPVTAVTEKIPASNLSAEIIYVEMNDGTYSPTAMMKPPGSGRFPLVVIAHMNGGGGTRWLREWLQYGNWTPEQLVKAGYAVAWMRYRSEVNNSYGSPLKETSRQGRQLFNRGPLEYDDAIAIVKFAKTLPYVDPDRIGYLGLSHGGEMAFKIGSEYDGLKCMIAVEPAAGEYLGVGPRPPGSPRPPETRMDITQEIMDKELADTRARTNMTIAKERIGRIKTPILVIGRINDDNEPQFRLAYEIGREMGKPFEWKQYSHAEHGFIFVRKNKAGVYDPDPTQRQIVADTVAHFNGCLK